MKTLDPSSKRLYPKFSDPTLRSIAHLRVSHIVSALDSMNSPGAPDSEYEATAQALRKWAEYSRHFNKGRPEWRDEFIEISLAWLGFYCSFEAAKKALNQTLTRSMSEPITPRELMAIRRFVSSMGFFSLAESLEARAIQGALFDFAHFPNRWSARNAFAANLMLGKINSALVAFRSISDGRKARSYGKIGELVNLLSSRSPNEEADIARILVGPGPLGEQICECPSDSIVCRVLMPGVVSWSEDDFTEGRADIGYLNGMTTNWLSGLSHSERKGIIDRFSRIYVKKPTNWSTEFTNVGVSTRITGLFLDGDPNMVPIILANEILNNVSRVYVAGVTFFVGEEPYRSTDRRRFGGSGKSADALGRMSSAPFERCLALSSHDAPANRKVVRMFLNSGHVSGDTAFMRTIRLSDHDYLLELEDLYGRHRR